MKKIQATLISNKITSNSSEAHSLFSASRFGEKLNQKIIYSLPEAFFLIENKKMSLQDFRGKILTQNETLKKIHRLDKNFLQKYIVFKDLRTKGYIVKTALKFGAEFRIYEKGKKIENTHSKWICFPISENSKTTWQNFVAKNRVAHSSKKNLLLAIVDEEGQVSYFEIKWTRP
ncbi:tRNA-intron lyase [archaeon]|nr:tRNA-intron lyase [archaeon]